MSSNNTLYLFIFAIVSCWCRSLRRHENRSYLILLNFHSIRRERFFSLCDCLLSVQTQRSLNCDVDSLKITLFVQ